MSPGNAQINRVVGIDGGGSKTLYVSLGRDGRVLGQARSRGINPIDNPGWQAIFSEAVAPFAPAPRETVAVAAAPAAAAAAAPVEEKTEFTVVLKSVGDKKIDVIKVIRALTNLGLKEAKDMAETAGAKVLEAVSKESAEDAKKKLTEVGATVDLV